MCGKYSIFIKQTFQALVMTPFTGETNELVCLDPNGTLLAKNNSDS